MIRPPPFAPLAGIALAMSFCSGTAAWAQSRQVPTVAPPQAAASQAVGQLPPVVERALRLAAIPSQAVSLLVQPVDAGPARLDHLSQVARQPASLIKLFTTGAALLTLGPAHTWRTDVALGGPLRPDGRLQGPLYVRGSGDPSLVLENVWLMLSRWRAAGLQDIEQGIVLDRQAFVLPPHDPSAFDGEPLKPYNAGPDALLLNHQAITLRLSLDAAQSGRVRVSMEPELDGVRLDSTVLVQDEVDCGDWRSKLTLSQLPIQAASRGGANAGAWILRLRGSYARACASKEWPLLWHGDGPGDHAARLMRQIWRTLGGRIGAPGIVNGAWPDGTPVWQSWVSPPLLKVVYDINKFSNNVMARQLFLALAPAPATLPGAREAVLAQVRLATRLPPPSGRSPCDGDALQLDNGSGLSRNEQSTAACIGQWLQAMWVSPVMPELLASLPVTGVDGTARRLGKDALASGRAHIKTGSLDGVSAMAGFVDGESGRRHIVVGIINHPQAKAGRPVLDALLAWAIQDGGQAPPP